MSQLSLMRGFKSTQNLSEYLTDRGFIELVISHSVIKQVQAFGAITIRLYPVLAQLCGQILDFTSHTLVALLADSILNDAGHVLVFDSSQLLSFDFGDVRLVFGFEFFETHISLFSGVIGKVYATLTHISNLLN